jgi:tripartite-type tricarboxylate transporter receptor subunit TctC
VLSGRVDALFNEVALLSQHGQDGGSLRILAIASPRRSPKLPNVPTTAEQGYPRVVIARGTEFSPPPIRRGRREAAQ